MEQVFRGVFAVRGAVDHDHAAGLDAFTTGAGRVADVRVGNVHRQVETVADLAPVDPVEAFRGALVAFHQLRPLGTLAQGNAIGFERLAVIDQLQLMGRLENQDFLDDLAVQGFHGRSLGHRDKRQTEQGKQPAH
ncbi:hypothetical protein D9M71_311160 [compost metagenome]